MISLDDVTVAVRGRAIIDRCTATFESGTVTHLSGLNGSGKTTLVRALAGLQRYSGSIRFDGTDAARARRSVYVCFDDAAVFPFLSGYDNVALLLGRAVDRAELAGATPLIADASLLRLPARRLSHGQRKRIHLAAALASGAEHLVFDEALDGVDAPTLFDLVAELGRIGSRAVIVTGRTGPWPGAEVRRMRIRNGRLEDIPPQPDGGVR